MSLRSLTYTSVAAPGLTAEDIESIHQVAVTLNARDGITGLLVYNGAHFLQIVEGKREPIYALVERLRGDQRHSGMTIRDDAAIEARSFPDWSMELVRVGPMLDEASKSIDDSLPAGIDDHVRARVLRMGEMISAS